MSKDRVEHHKLMKGPDAGAEGRRCRAAPGDPDSPRVQREREIREGKGKRGGHNV